MVKIADKTKDEKSHTEKKPVNIGSKSLTWSIRDVDLETRMIIAKAAKLHSKTISEYVIQDVRALAQSQLSQTTLPATSQDMNNQISLVKIMDKLEGIESRLLATEKKPLWKKLFS